MPRPTPTEEELLAKSDLAVQIARLLSRDMVSSHVVEEVAYALLVPQPLQFLQGFLNRVREETEVPLDEGGAHEDTSPPDELPSTPPEDNGRSTRSAWERLVSRSRPSP